MEKSVQKGFAVIILICLIVWSAIIAFFISDYMMAQTQFSMTYSLSLTDRILDYDGDLQAQAEELNDIILDSSSRITIVENDGDVVADTSPDIDFNENHMQREEIKEAAENGSAMSIRYSKTMKRELIYATLLCNDGEYIVRIALPYNGRVVFIKSLIPVMVLSVVITFAVALLIAKKISKDITGPLSEISEGMTRLNLDGEKIELNDNNYIEIDNIITTINSLSERIAKGMYRLKREKNKINYILDNMGEGLIILDQNKEVMIINKAASIYLDSGLAEKGNHIVKYTQRMPIIKAVSDVIDNGGEKVLDITDNKNRIISVRINEIDEGIINKNQSGAIMLMIDVTAERVAQATRQEFFSNASHELKTPITSIQGYAELLTSEIPYNEEQKKEFLRRIKSESMFLATHFTQTRTLPSGLLYFIAFTIKLFKS